MGDSPIPKQVSQLGAVGFVWEIFMVIAIPTVGCALLGRYLDNRWNTTPYLTVVGLVLALAISGWLVYVKAKRFAQEMKK